MRSTTQLLTAALSLAILGDLLLRVEWGLNLVLWIIPLLLWTARVSAISPLHSGLGLPIIFFAACVGWHAAPELRLLNVAAVMGLLTLPLLQKTGMVLRTAPVITYLRGTASTALEVWRNATGFLVTELPTSLRSSGSFRHASAVAVGLVFALPIGVTFLILFSSADPVFSRAAMTVLRFDPGNAMGHVLLGGTIGFASLGYLSHLVSPDTDSPPWRSQAQEGRFGIVEIAIPLGILIGLCATFIAFQVPYLFGGQDAVREIQGLTYAIYARRGFFELTVASALVVPILLAADLMLESRSASRKAFAILGFVQTGLVGLLMTSALQRMFLYWKEFGLTTNRLYATGFMVWTGSVLIWLAMTVLRGRRRTFAFGSIVSGLLVLAALNFVNPEGLVVRLNLARSAPFDWDYATQLGPDAAPPLSRNLSRLPQVDRCTIVTNLELRWNASSHDWRSWNIARARAVQLSRNELRPLIEACDSTR